jgi:hypothetical protein
MKSGSSSSSKRVSATARAVIPAAEYPAIE